MCLLTQPAAQALAAVQRDLRGEGLGLRVYDCYRPQRAVDRFMRWAADLGDQRTKPTFYPRVAKQELIARGYIAERSGHSRGSTVDLTLVGADGAPLEMGTPFDLFDERSHTESPAVPAAARANREKLRAAMERRGFRNLAVEWWHYTLDGRAVSGPRLRRAGALILDFRRAIRDRLRPLRLAAGVRGGASQEGDRAMTRFVSTRFAPARAAALVAVSIAVFAAASANAEKRPEGEPVKWDQARVTQLAKDLNKAVNEAVHAVRKSPTQQQVSQRQSWYDMRESLRLLDNTTGHLQSELQKGARPGGDARPPSIASSRCATTPRRPAASR